MTVVVVLSVMVTLSAVIVWFVLSRRVVLGLEAAVLPLSLAVVLGWLVTERASCSAPTAIKQ